MELFYNCYKNKDSDIKTFSKFEMQNSTATRFSATSKEKLTEKKNVTFCWFVYAIEIHFSYALFSFFPLTVEECKIS